MEHLNLQRDDKNRRIVSREQLFRDPDNFQFTCLFNSEEGCINSHTGISHESDWTASNFSKSNETDFTKSNQRKALKRNSIEKKLDRAMAQPVRMDKGERGCINSHTGISHESDWTASNFSKSNETDFTKSNQRKALKRNSIEKKLDRAMAQPVRMDKGERMMQKMGWQGGALGKDGFGITTPIIPNAAYATTTLGLGHKTMDKTQISKPPTKRNNKDFFTANILLTILDFLKNDSEIELIYSKELFKVERKEIHDILTKIDVNAYQPLYNLSTVQQGDILAEIIKCNQFVLCAQSSGKKRDRALCLYKEAPPVMYLVTPDDLKPDEQTNTETIDTEPLKTEEENNSITIKDAESNQSNRTNEIDSTKPLKTEEKINEIASNDDESNKSNQTNEIEAIKLKTDTEIDETIEMEINKSDEINEDESKLNTDKEFDETTELESRESNPFLQSIIRANKKTDKQQTEALVNEETKSTTEENKIKVEKPFNIKDTIIEYYKEFCNDPNYNQFRFVGPFSGEEFRIINRFFSDIKMAIDNKDFKVIFDGYDIDESLVEVEIKEDRNGHRAIYKKQKR